MKIGRFASMNKISIDAVRYYMELGLLIPQRNGSQYEFDDKCQSDVEEILWLKSAGFSLNEIQRVFSLKRMTSLKDEEDLIFYRSLFGDKHKELVRQRNELNRIIARLEEKQTEVEGMTMTTGVELGVTLDFLHLLTCPYCKQKLRLLWGNIDNGMIMDGELGCSCGKSMSGSFGLDGELQLESGQSDRNGSGQDFEIIQGIVVNKRDVNSTPHHEEKLDGHFIEQTSADYVNLLYKSGQWIASRLDLKSVRNTVILEPGTGSGLFLNAVLNDMRSDCIYICVDHNLELLKSTKKTIEKHGNKGNIIFICCDFRRIPIEEESIDFLIDHFGTTNFNFYNEGFLIEILDHLVKPGGTWLGDYMSFKPGAKSLLQFEERFRSYFYSRNIMDALEKSGFSTCEIREMGYTQKGGVYEKFFIEGDTLYDFVYHGQKPRKE